MHRAIEADTGWRETPADEWGLNFGEKRFGAVPVVASFNVMAYIHHHYCLDAPRIEKSMV